MVLRQRIAMKAIISAVVFLMIVVGGWVGIASAGQGMGPGPGVKGYAATDLLVENFSTGSAPSGWTTGTGIVFNYATTPAPMEGSYSYALDSSLTGSSITAYSATFTASSDVYIACRYFYSTASVGDSGVAFGVADASNNWMAYFQQDVSNNFDGVTTGGTAISDFYTLTIDTPVYIKMRYRKGTGTNAIADFWTSSNGSTWTSEGSITNGTATTDAVKLIFRAASSSNMQSVYDRIKVSTSDINY